MVRGLVGVIWGPPQPFSDGSRRGVRPINALRPIDGRGPSYQDDGQPLARIIQRAARGATVLRNLSLTSADERGLVDDYIDTASAPAISSLKMDDITGFMRGPPHIRRALWPINGRGSSYQDDGQPLVRIIQRAVRGRLYFATIL
ncbi:hypothetical protein TWF192_004606 [Orbilia oligospora]|uniref:Uncharacterized protein n=1 Tax=Orbilia oligospora TaxID=2813651 RepID=A0A6G1MCJ0_ORBOL|nr:hypothetical protein TWF679_006132 [Orbilia oligospora]KAF3228178.1 hypothetical protein TWF191_003115 [Orbilia oligospora]KAF3252153.1 hypothetical protein TWF192_004606 [Orbilia oligospora]